MLHLHALRHVDEASRRDQTAVLSAANLLSSGRDDRAEVLAGRSPGSSSSAWSMPEEDDAELLEVLADVVVDDLGVVLGADAGEELLLRLGDAELVEGAPDVVRHVVPGLDRLVGGVRRSSRCPGSRSGDRSRAPGRHRARLEVAVRLEAELGHPLRLALEAADLLDDLAESPFFWRCSGDFASASCQPYL